MAVMADFARMPTQRKVLLFAVAGVLIWLLYWKFVYQKLVGDLEEARGKHGGEVALSKKLDDDLKDYTDLKPKLKSLLVHIDQNEKALPTEAAMPAFFETLDRKVMESGVQVNHSARRPDEPVEAFVRVPIDYEIQGTFMQIKRFFASLLPHDGEGGTGAGAANPSGATGDSAPERERIVSIEDLSINDPQVRNHEIVLTAKFTALTFREERTVEPAKPAGPGAGNSGAGGASGAKPLPPAATPAGAKARVDDAMQKDEQRSGSDRLRGGL